MACYYHQSNHPITPAAAGLLFAVCQTGGKVAQTLMQILAPVIFALFVALVPSIVTLLAKGRGRMLATNLVVMAIYNVGFMATLEYLLANTSRDDWGAALCLFIAALTNGIHVLILFVVALFVARTKSDS